MYMDEKLDNNPIYPGEEFDETVLKQLYSAFLSDSVIRCA